MVCPRSHSRQRAGLGPGASELPFGAQALPHMRGPVMLLDEGSKASWSLIVTLRPFL